MPIKESRGNGKTQTMFDDLMERIVTAQDEMLRHEIEANTVTLNGNKYGILIGGGVNQYGEQYYITPTIFGMAVKTDYSMPDDIDFFVQYIKPTHPTNADRIRAIGTCKDCEYSYMGNYFRGYACSYNDNGIDPNTVKEDHFCGYWKPKYKEEV